MENLEQRMYRLRREKELREQREREDKARRDSENRVAQENRRSQDLQGNTRVSTEVSNELSNLVKRIGARHLLEEVRDKVWRTGNLVENISGIKWPESPDQQSRGFTLSYEHPSVVEEGGSIPGNSYSDSGSWHMTHPHLGIRVLSVGIGVDSHRKDGNLTYWVGLYKIDVITDPEHDKRSSNYRFQSMNMAQPFSLFRENATSPGIADRLGNAVARYCLERDWPAYLRNETERAKQIIKKSSEIPFWKKMFL